MTKNVFSSFFELYSQSTENKTLVFRFNYETLKSSRGVSDSMSTSSC